MRYRQLGRTQLSVSEIGLGSWVFGGDAWGDDVDDERSCEVIRAALDRGVNFIDTAPVYGHGRAESVIGRAVAQRDRVVIATKCGLERRGRSFRPNLSAAFVRTDLENSLRRLRTDHVDLYQCHWPDPRTPLEETIGELELLKKQGKIRHIGVSNFSLEELKEAAGLTELASVQVQYSLLAREAERGIMPWAADNGISVIAYGALGGGILTGKYKALPVMSKTDARSFFYRFYREPVWSRIKRSLDVMEKEASGNGCSMAQAAIRWVLWRDEIASCLVGCRSVGQLCENIDAHEAKLSSESFAVIDESFGKALLSE